MAESEATAKGQPEGSKDSATVVIAMDGSEYSDYALTFYTQCLHRPGNRVMVVHNTDLRVVSHPAVSMMSGGTDVSLAMKEIKAEESRATELMKKLEERMKELNIDGKLENIHGETGPSLVTYVTDNKADYVVVGCRGKGKLRKTFTGSITDYVTHHSHVPVVIARNIDHLEKLHLHMPFKHHKKNEGPTSPTSPKSPGSPQSPMST